MRNKLGLSGGRISRLKSDPQGILVNGEKVYTTFRVHPGDVLTVFVGDLPKETQVPAIPGQLDVAYEDRELLVIHKSAGIAVHADSRRPEEVTLENAILAYLPQGSIAHPVNRLDRGTTGLMVYAKSGYVHELLRRQIHTETFFREYLAIAEGLVEPPNGEIGYSIGFYPGSHYRRAALIPGQAGTVDPEKPVQTARTHYETIQRTKNRTLLHLIPETGRTHQLRVHMASLGYPLCGDWLYGFQEPEGWIARPALHSSRLTLDQPISGKRLTFESPMPEDMERLMQR